MKSFRKKSEKHRKKAKSFKFPSHESSTAPVYGLAFSNSQKKTKQKKPNKKKLNKGQRKHDT